MPYWRMTLYTMLAGVAAIWLLGSLPPLEKASRELSVRSAMAVPRQTLSDDNLADAMAGLRMRERLTGVEWDHSILTVDLAIRGESGHAQPPVRDLTALVRYAFGETENVRRLLFRIYRDNGGKRTLLMYGDARREDWSRDELSALEPETAKPDETFGRKLRLSKTPAGERWFRNLAN